MIFFISSLPGYGDVFAPGNHITWIDESRSERTFFQLRRRARVRRTDRRQKHDLITDLFLSAPPLSLTYFYGITEIPPPPES